MIKKILIGGAVLVAVGAGYWLISPLFIEEQVNESLEDISQPITKTATTTQQDTEQLTTLRSGTFSGLAGHSGTGTVILLERDGVYYIRFEGNFRVTNGPDLFVHFGKDGEYAASARIGALKGNVGGQNYKVPTDIDPTAFNEVWVWCRAFSVPFARAVLE